MPFTQDISLILLTYKGKILLMTHEELNPSSSNSHWFLIGGAKHKNEKIKDAIVRIVEKETSLRLSNIASVFEQEATSGKRIFYHASLTDHQVNNIKRIDGHLLNFFSLKEAEELPQSPIIHTLFDIPGFLSQKN